MADKRIDQLPVKTTMTGTDLLIIEDATTHQYYQGSITNTALQGPQGVAGPTGPAGSNGTAGTNGTNGAAATVAVGTTTTGAAGSSAAVTNTGTSSAAVLAFTVPQGAIGATGATGTTGTAATVNVGTTTTGAAGSSASVTNTGTTSAAVFAFTVPQGATGATGPAGTNGTNGTNGTSVAAKDEGVSLTTAATSMNFVGAGVTATTVGSDVTVTVPGGSGTSGTVTSVTSADVNATVATSTTTPVITVVSAPKLLTARTINGVAFDGSINITVADATKEPTITAGTIAQYYRGDKSFQTLDKTAVGLANVDNTSDVNKPVSTAAQTALNLKANLASPTFTGTVTVPTPVSATDASNKGYVDSVATGLDVKASVRLASNTNHSLTAPGTIDSVTLATNDRVLLKNQTTASENGIYSYNGTALVRSIDADTSAEVTSGMFAFTSEGTINAGKGYVLTTPDPITLGTTALTFGQFSATGGGITALTGDVTASGSGSVAATLASIITAGSSGSATQTSAIIYDAKGRLTSVAPTSIQIAESQVTNLTTDLAAKYDKTGGAISGVVSIAGTAAGTAGQLVITDSSSSPGITLNDTSLFRSGAGQLQTSGILWSIRASSGVEAIGTGISGDTARRIAMFTDGVLKFSSGSATADTTVARNSTGGLQITNTQGTTASPASYVLRITPAQTSSSVSTGGALFISNTANYGSAINVFSAAQSSITPLSVTATAASSKAGVNPISTYTFAWGDATANTGPQATTSATHAYASPGTYTVTVTVTDSLGNTATQNSNITVTTPTAPTAALSASPTSVAANFTVTADASASTQGTNAIATYTFAWGDATANTGPQTTNTATHVYTVAGSYTITLTVTSADGTTSTATQGVTITSATANPTAAISLSATSQLASTMKQTQVNSPSFNAIGEQIKYNGTSHAMAISSTGIGTNSQALNVVSTNPNDTTLGVNGAELGRGTVKIVHSGTGGDANASALSMRFNGSGTAAQGIFIDSDTAAVTNIAGTYGTTGNILTLRNGGFNNQVTTLDYQGQLFNRNSIQIGNGTSGDFGGGVGVVGIKDAATLPTTNPTAGVILYSDAGVLKWRNPAGTVYPLNVSGGSGITRSVSNISTTTTAGATASTDYVYFCTGTFNLTLPSATANTNRYTVKNVGTGIITVVGTIDGGSNAILNSQYQAIDLISDNTAWNVI